MKILCPDLNLWLFIVNLSHDTNQSDTVCQKTSLGVWFPSLNEAVTLYLLSITSRRDVFSACLRHLPPSLAGDSGFHGNSFRFLQDLLFRSQWPADQSAFGASQRVTAFKGKLFWTLLLQRRRQRCSRHERRTQLGFLSLEEETERKAGRRPTGGTALRKMTVPSHTCGSPCQGRPPPPPAPTGSGSVWMDLRHKGGTSFFGWVA